MREETEFRPKPMVEIGGRPVLWHIMKNFSDQGHKEFIILAGYRANVIREYLLHLRAYSNDFRVSTGPNGQVEILGDSEEEEEWKITLLDTGSNSETGSRLRRAKEAVGEGKFLCVYGDGLASVDVSKLLFSHETSGKLGTMTVTRPTNRFGVVTLGKDGGVTNFAEKPRMTDYINIGFFVFETDVFDLIGDANESVETGLLDRLVVSDNLNSFRHEGFWEPMDTFREYQKFNSIWESGERPWQVKKIH
jgi:glucose-1-phosphate cytidylyltransferase